MLTTTDQTTFKNLNNYFSGPIKKTCTKTITFKNAHSLLSSDYKVHVEDLEATVWEAVLKNIKKNPDLPIFFENPEGYIRTIAIRKSINFMRKIIQKHKHHNLEPGKDTTFVSFDKLLEDGQENDSSLINYSQLGSIDEIFNHLNQNEKDILLLKGLGFTKKEMAESLGISEGTVYKQLTLIKKKITPTD